jgi:hypothetical protein
MAPGGTVGDIPHGKTPPHAAQGTELLTSAPECRPTDWYLSRIAGRKRRRGNGLPHYRPVTRAQLRNAGVTRAGVPKNYLRVEYGMYVRRRDLVAENGTVTVRSVAAAVLTMAHALRHPHRIATGFAAASMFGMTCFVAEEPLEFLAPPRSGDSVPAHNRLRRTSRLSSFRDSAVVADSRDPVLRKVICTDAGTTLAAMLSTLLVRDRARSDRWPVADLTEIRPHLSPEFIRCVQVSDAFHQALGMRRPGTVAEVTAAGLVEVPDAAAVLGATEVGAESPQETLLRLVVADLAPGLRSQIPVWRDDGTLLTVVDLGWESRRVYLFYDGEHHLQRKQRDHDSEVLASLQHDGGRVLRVTAGDLKTVEAVVTLRDRVRAALGVD